MSTATIERRGNLAAYEQAVTRHTDTAASDAKAIAEVALTKLLPTLEHHGNRVGAKHRQALADLTYGLACQLTRCQIGRRGYPLTCGAGKTQALVAVLAATHELGLGYSVVVAAQKVTDLVKIRRDLRMKGVADEVIGLIHSKPARVPLRELADADPPVTRDDCTSTDKADRQFLLATHELLRQGRWRELVTKHHGQQRNLMVWDETLLLSEAGAITVKDVESAALHFGEQAIAGAFLRRVASSAGEEMIQQLRGRAPTPFTIDCDPKQQEELQSMAHRGYRRGEMGEAAAKVLRNVISLVGQCVAVALPKANGEAIIHHEIVIDPTLDNIAVLDASHVVRLLGRLGVREATSDAMRGCKRYDGCTANLYPFAASRATQSAKAKLKKLAALAAQVIAAIPARECAVLFTFKATRSALEKELRAAGIDLGEMVGGKLRIAIDTWGNEAGTNQYAHCKHVVLVGVLRQDRARLMAQWTGELDDLANHPDADRLREVELSEMASCVLQALSRGQSRQTRLGPDGESQAYSQSVHIIDADAVPIAELLHRSSSLLGMRWTTGATGKVESLTTTVAKAIAVALAGLPMKQAEVSTTKLKRLVLDAGAPSVIVKTFTAALDEACRASAWSGAQTWQRDGRSVRRVASQGLEALDLRGIEPSRN